MAAKIISFDEEARRGLERGMDQLANAVKSETNRPALRRRGGARPRVQTP